MMDTIETDRLILRPWTANDLNDVYEGLNDYDVAKNLTVPYPYTKECAESFIKTRMEKPNTIEKSYLAIVEKSSGRVIGGTTIEFRDGIARGGIWLNKKYHGRGYGSETMHARAVYCFDTLKVDHLENGFLEGNETSRRMQEKLGYKLTGELSTQNCPARGGITKEIRTILTRENFVR